MFHRQNYLMLFYKPCTNGLNLDKVLFDIYLFETIASTYKSTSIDYLFVTCTYVLTSKKQVKTRTYRDDM